MTALDGRERLLRAFSQQPVDRIPVSPFIHINYVKEFFGSHDVDWVARTPEVYRHFGFDLIHRNCSPDYDFIGPAGPDWQLTATRHKEGRDETTTTLIHTPGGSLRCVQALRWTYEYDAENSLVEYPIKNEADFDLMVRYQPDPEPADVSDVRRARDLVGDTAPHDERGITAPWIHGAFNIVAVYYRKLDDLLLDAMINPSFYQRMMEHFSNRYMPFIQQIIDAGADVISYAANIANGKLVSPKFFRQQIWPYEKRLIDFVQQQGVAVLYHNCGYARNLLPLLSGLEMRAYESLTPPPYGDTILTDAIEAFGPRTTLSGNIDQLDLLRKGTHEEIESTVRQVLDQVRGRCHFVLATTDYFNENTPHEKIHVLADAGRKYGVI
jgi:uroporphyrinogen-III decarboxylase